MAKKKNSEPEQPVKVYCADCRWFTRDTDGISRSFVTGEYFMGICKYGINDGYRKVFCDKHRFCDKFRKA